MPGQRVDYETSFWEVLVNLPQNVVKSIWPTEMGSKNDRTRVQTTFNNLFLHFQSSTCTTETLRFTYTMGFGLISFYLFIILTITGILLMFYYVPSVEQAYARMLDLRSSVLFGDYLRNMHRWAAHAMVLFVFLHMARVFFTGCYYKPKEFNWVVGIGLFLLTLFLSFTGYLLPWDQLALWAIQVGTSIASYTPVIGPQIRYVLIGSTTLGQEALIRFYTLHVIVLPLAAAVLIAVHFWRIHKDGGLTHHPRNVTPDLGMKKTVTGFHRRKDLSFPGTTKTYGLLGIADASRPTVQRQLKDRVFSWPDLILREVIVFAVLFAVLTVVSLLIQAPLEEPANPAHPTNPSKAPWYFLGLQELVSYDAFWGGIGIPGIVMTLLALTPYLDRAGIVGKGVWFHRRRLLVNSLFGAFVLLNIFFIVLGTYFRGPNWEFILPWNLPPLGKG